MSKSPRRFIAVDWSGDKSISGQRRKIWIADWDDGDLTLTSGRTRDQVSEYLINAACKSLEMVAGLDFAFSYPAWFVREQGCKSAEEFWALVTDGKGEDWLTRSNEFCWGKKGRPCPEDHREPDWKGFRRTDRELSIGSVRPKSPFQIGGAGAVGTGSLRGIPILHQLRNAGFSIWPFTEAGFPVAIEIYPRLFTGIGNKSSAHFRASRLAEPDHAGLSKEVIASAMASEDAFDALCSVIGMQDHADELANLTEETDPNFKLEGKIWRPRPSGAAASAR
jgi:hypothetical protein